MKRNLLIFHQAALGDFIITWPLAVALARMYPQSRVIYVTAGSKGKLAEQVLGVESIDAQSGWHGLFADSVQLPEANCRMLANSHLIVSFSSRDDRWESNVNAIAAHASLIRLNTKSESLDSISEDLPDELAGHVISHLLHQLRPHPAIHAAMTQILRSVMSRGLSGRRAPKNRVVIHPGAGHPEKCWAVENFLELVERLSHDGVEARVLFGEAELDRWAPSVIRRVESIADVHRPQTYLKLLDEIASANVFIGNDSGPGHLAGIIGVPTVCLFGSSADRWKPLGPRVKIVRAPAIQHITVADVMSAIAGFNKSSSLEHLTSSINE